MTNDDIFQLAEKNGWQDDFGRWNFQDDGLLDFVHELRQSLNVDAVNISQERVDETAKGEHSQY